MNILKRELKADMKPFLFWTIGLFVLVFAGVIKSTGLATGGEEITALTQSFPQIVLAVIGMAGVNIGTFGGFYAVLAQYAIILTAVFAVYLGNSAVSREAVDKTYEFVFTKPRSRSYILAWKLIAGAVYLTAFCLLDFIFSLSATATINVTEDFTATLALFAVATYLIGLVFFAFGAMFAALLEHTERGTRAGNITVLATFAIGVVYDMMDNGAVIRFFSPLKYFTPSEMLEGNLNPLFIIISLLLVALALTLAFRRFEKRDLKAM